MFAPPPLPRTLAASLRDISSSKPSTRASAIGDLARHAAQDEETRKRAIGLFEVALRDEAAVVRSAAAVALGDLSADVSLPGLLVAIEDPDQHTRQMALNALGEIGDRRALTRLERALHDERPDVRYQGLLAFVRVAIKIEQSIGKALSDALRDEDDAVRYIAVRLVEERLHDVPADADVLMVSERVRALLDDSSQHVALAAAIFLSQRGDQNARALVARVVAGERFGSGRPEREDEEEAVELVGRLEMKECVPDLERRAWGLGRFVRDTCSWHAKIALARLGHARARSEILRDLSSPRTTTLSAAIVAAGRARLLEARPLLETLAGKADADLLADAVKKLNMP